MLKGRETSYIPKSFLFKVVNRVVKSKKLTYVINLFISIQEYENDLQL